MEVYNSFYKLKDTNIDDASENANYIYISQDRYEGRGEKFFYKIPINETDEFFNKHLNADYHLYEIIPENVPVKAYFDLEIEQENAHVNSLQRVNMFIDWALPIMNELYNVNITKDDVIYLNSTRENKLSYHVVIHNYMFNNNAEQKTLDASGLTYPNLKPNLNFAQNRNVSVFNSKAYMQYVPIIHTICVLISVLTIFWKLIK